MTEKPDRIIDAHVHLWDPARTDWYPYLSRPPAGSSGDPSRMSRRFDVETYRAESADWKIDAFVNVAAATGTHSVEETIELDEKATARGGPDAIIGGLPPTESSAESIELLDRQMTASRFRGVRPMGGLDQPLPDAEVLHALRERGLVFELLTHPDQLQAVAGRLRGFEDLVVVVEHVGWPRTNTEEERVLWQTGMHALADSGPNVVCKLSGLAMPLQSMMQEDLAPWLEYAIDEFGADRCLFASNFPVDAVYGSFDDLYTAFNAITASLDDGSRDKLFAGTAERIYRL
jgi:L-fuconolactonase